MRITKLDGLRGIFSLLIVPIHYSYFPEFLNNNFFINQSYTFVDFFFVLSGFVIAYNYNSISNYNDFWVYMKKRIARLYPLLLFTATLFLGYLIFKNYMSDFFPTTADKIYSTNELLYQYIETLLLENANPIFGSGLGINSPTWSISAEITSYLVFGFVSIYAIGRTKNITLTLITLISILFFVYKGSLFWTGSYGFIRSLISFNLGYFVWLTYKMKFKLNNNLEYLIPILLVIIFYFLNKIENGMFGLSVIPLFFSLSIVTLLKTDGLLSKLLDTKPIQFLGKISYSIYLNHLLVVSLTPKIMFSIFKVPRNTTTEILVFLVSILIVVIYSNYTYKFIEVKGGKYLRKLMLK